MRGGDSCQRTISSAFDHYGVSRSKSRGQGVLSGAHGATNKEHQVCARRRVGEAAVSPLGSEGCESAVW